MSFFFSKHHTLHYVTRGNRTQPPLLLLHGFLGSHQDFAPVLPTLSLYFYCIVPDLPGHGQTKTEPDAYTFPKTAESLLALLSHLNICETHLLGYSMGGRLALYLACEFPDCFISVVLESASPGLKTAEQRVERRKRDGAIAHRLQTTPLSTFLHQWYRNPLFSSLQQHPDKHVAMLQCRKNNAPVALASALQGLGTGQQPSLWKALESMERPLLLIVGGLDTKFVAINDEMVTTTLGRRGVRLEVIENCGHNLHLEAPTIYAHIVLLFLVGRL
ncbi:MAG: 2-succinyl-6-hydroxy-2,4-cyclohexadiene-1-carboxylate synthase [Phormidesmis sp.]